MNNSENKRTAIVVGGSSGIGYEVCNRLTGRGWTVYNISRTPCKCAKVHNFPADVAAGSAVEDAINKIARENGVYALIYSAGFSMAAPIEHAKEADYKYLFEVNFFGALRCMQTVIPYMKGTGGRIILIGSLGGDIPIVFDSFYSASKAALEMLCRSAYSELGKERIRVTALLPGGTSTNFTFKRKVYSDEENKSYSSGVNKAVAALAHMEQSGMSPVEVADIIYKLLISDKPPVVKSCGFKNTAFRYASRVMPEKWTLKFNDRVYDQ